MVVCLCEDDSAHPMNHLVRSYGQIPNTKYTVPNSKYIVPNTKCTIQNTKKLWCLLFHMKLLIYFHEGSSLVISESRGAWPEQDFIEFRSLSIREGAKWMAALSYMAALGWMVGPRGDAKLLRRSFHVNAQFDSQPYCSSPVQGYLSRTKSIRYGPSFIESEMKVKWKRNESEMKVKVKI